MNLHNAGMNELVSTKSATFLWITLLFSDCLSLMMKGANLSTQECVNVGASIILSTGILAIFRIPNFSWSIWQVKHCCMMLLLIAFPWITQYPDCQKLFKVDPLPPCTTALWHYWTMAFVTAFFFGSNGAWIFLADLQPPLAHCHL